MRILALAVAGRPMSRNLKAPVAALLLGLTFGFALEQGVTAQERIACLEDAEHWRGQASHWKNEATQLNGELSRINRKSEKKLYIQSVDVTVVKSSLSRDAVDKAMAPYTQALLGLSLAYLNAPVIYHLFNGRIIVVGTRLYQLQVQALLLAPHTELMLSVHPAPSSAAI